MVLGFKAMLQCCTLTNTLLFCNDWSANDVFSSAVNYTVQLLLLLHSVWLVNNTLYLLLYLGFK